MLSFVRNLFSHVDKAWGLPHDEAGKEILIKIVFSAFCHDVASSVNTLLHRRASWRRGDRLVSHSRGILKPVSEPGYFVASWWRTPLHDPPKVILTNRFYFQQTFDIHTPVGKRKGGSLSGRSPAPIVDSSNVATIARKQRVEFTRN
jgi:hypothetical protein